MIIEGTEKKNNDGDITSQVITKVNVISTNRDIAIVFGKKAGDKKEIVRMGPSEEFQFFGYATNVAPETKSPFPTLQTLGLVKYKKSCLEPFLLSAEAVRDRIAAEAAAEKERLEKEKEEGQVTKGDGQDDTDDDDKIEEENDTSGAVVVLIIIIVLAAIAGVLVCVFRKRLNLEDKCCTCCFRSKTSQVEELTFDPDSSSREPIK